jgi:hypothetical protein
MLNSQHRNNKKNNAPQAAMLIIFFVEPCRKTANASPSGVVNHESFFMLSPSSRSTAKPAAAWQLLYVLFLEKVRLLRFKAATVITSELFLWLTKKNY